MKDCEGKLVKMDLRGTSALTENHLRKSIKRIQPQKQQNFSYPNKSLNGNLDQIAFKGFISKTKTFVQHSEQKPAKILLDKVKLYICN